MKENFRVTYNNLRGFTSYSRGLVMKEKEGIQGIFYEEMIAGEPPPFSYNAPFHVDPEMRRIVEETGVAVVEFHQGIGEVKIDRSIGVRQATPDEITIFAKGMVVAVASLPPEGDEANRAKELARSHMERMTQSLSGKGYDSHAKQVSQSRERI